MKNLITNSATTVIEDTISVKEEIAIATKAFIFGLPLVLFDITKEQSTNYVKAISKGAPVNQFSKKSKFPDSSDTSVVRPNCDTYYCTAFLDLSDGPLVMSVPATADEYYMLPFLDAYTNAIKYSPGTRTEEIEGGNYLIVGPDSGDVSDSNIPNLVNTIRSSTNFVWILGRFQVNDPNNDGATAIQLQEQTILTPLSKWGTDYQKPDGIERKMDTRDPNTIVADMSMSAFFARMNRLLVKNPPAEIDQEEMAEFRKIGVGVDVPVPFNEMRFKPAIISAMDKIPSETLRALKTFSDKPADTPNGWTGLTQDTVANFGTDYFQRAMVAYIGLGANLVADAVYYKTLIDENKEQLDGSKKYIMTFDDAPPVKAFWSLTMYDKDGYFIDNPINRYALGHSDSDPLTYEDDGSLKIFIQNQALAESDPYYNNWLPAPSDEFNLLFRAYWPVGGIAEGSWEPPVVEVNEA